MNAKAKMNVPFGGSLTGIAVLPPGSERDLVDPFAEWYGLTPDGKILLMRDRSVQEIYALDLAKK